MNGKLEMLDVAPGVNETAREMPSSIHFQQRGPDWKPHVVVFSGGTAFNSIAGRTPSFDFRHSICYREDDEVDNGCFLRLASVG